MRKLLLIAAAALGCASCGNNYEIFNGHAQGTTYHIIVDGAPSDLQVKIDSVFHHADSTMSIFNPNSQVSRINRGENMTAGPEIGSCLTHAEAAYVFSKGSYDITVGPLVNMWGFGPAGKPAVEPTQQQIDSVLEFVGLHKIKFAYGRIFKDDPRVQLDLSSVAKGYTVDMMSKMLNRLGIENYLVEIGGEVRCKGISPSDRFWRVGIDNPDYRIRPNAEQTLVTLQIPSEMSVATSGNYRNYYTTESGQRVAHTLNALTGRPHPTGILSVTVVHPMCVRADAFATMIMTAAKADEADLTRWGNRIGNLGDIMVVYSDENGVTHTYVSPGMEKYILK